MNHVMDKKKQNTEQLLITAKEFENIIFFKKQFNMF